MTEKRRLLEVLAGRRTDRSPVICPGGMMSFAVTEVMRQCGAAWPEAHMDARLMATLAVAMREETGMESLAAPFCMTVEAEALGAQVTLGTETVQPRVEVCPFSSCRELAESVSAVAAGSARVATLLQAIGLLARRRKDIPVIGNIVGPVSLLASLIEPDIVFREMRRTPDSVHAALGLLTDWLIGFGLAQLRAGADVVTIAEPTGTGRILGPRRFAEFAAPSLTALVSALQEAGAPVILHICGDMSSILPQLGKIGADAISADAMVHLGALREAIAPVAVMGNISAFALELGPPSQIARWCRSVGASQADIIAPACGVVPTTPVGHLRAFCDAARLASAAP